MSRLPAATSARWVALGAVASGVLTYVLLFVVGRAVGPASFAQFNGFWAAVVVTSAGLFLPLEQAVARRVAASSPDRSGRSGRSAPPSDRPQGLAYALAGAVTVLGVPMLAVLTGGSGALPVTTAFLAAALGWAWQFPARGELAGAGLLREYAGVVVLEGALRVVGVVLLAIGGAQDPGWYALVVAGAGVGAGAAARHWARSARPSVGVRGAPEPAPVDDTLAPGAARPPAVGAHPPLAREVGGIAAALLSMQALLNSGNLVGAALADGPAPALAGSLVAALAIVRAPVFVQQLAQAAYLPRIASAHHRGDDASVRRTVRTLAAAVVCVGVLAVSGAALLGPWLVAVSFGPGFDVTRGTAALLALAVASYLAAAVANDVAVALGRYPEAARAWVLGLLVAVVCAVVLEDVTLRVAVPMLAGCATALVLLLAVVSRTTGRGGR